MKPIENTACVSLSTRN